MEVDLCLSLRVLLACLDMWTFKEPIAALSTCQSTQVSEYPRFSLDFIRANCEVFTYILAISKFESVQK